MNTLESLEIENFQSLVNTKIEFAPGLTCIIGPSNLGKSAAQRALRALVRNAAAPGLVRDGAGKFVVSATFSDGTKETLEKGKNLSTFSLTKPGQDAIINTHSGASAVPEEVDQLWALPDNDGSELCLATQHDPPYLLTQPASARAKVIGDLTNVSILLQAQQIVNKKRLQATNDEKSSKREYDEIKEALQAYAHVVRQTEVLKNLRELYDKATFDQEKASVANSLLEAIEAVATRQDEVEAALAQELKVLTKLATIVESVDTAIAAKRLLTKVGEILSYLTDWEVELDTEYQTIKDLENKKHELLVHYGICPTCNQKVKA